MSNRTKHVHLSGELNGDLCSKPEKEKWLPYKLTFEWVISLKVTELDTWESQRNWYNKTSFDVIENSDWLATIQGKKEPDYKHYIILTYDDVIEIACKSHKLEYGEPYA